jgi:hypothetical protein
MFLIGFKDYQHDNEISDKLMKFLLRAEFIHCELIFSDGKIGSSDMYQGVRIYPEDKTVTTIFGSTTKFRGSTKQRHENT